MVGPVPGEQLGWWCQCVSSRHHIQLAGMNSPSASCSPPFLLPLNTLQAEDTWPLSEPRDKLSGGHDKMGHQHIVERAPSLKPGRAPSEATNLLCGLKQII